MLMGKRPKPASVNVAERSLCGPVGPLPVCWGCSEAAVKSRWIEAAETARLRAFPANLGPPRSHGSLLRRTGSPWPARSNRDPRWRLRCDALMLGRTLHATSQFPYIGPDYFLGDYCFLPIRMIALSLITR